MKFFLKGKYNSRIYLEFNLFSSSIIYIWGKETSFGPRTTICIGIKALTLWFPLSTWRRRLWIKKHNRGGSVCNVKILINYSNTRYLHATLSGKKSQILMIKVKINGYFEPITLSSFPGSNDQLTRMWKINEWPVIVYGLCYAGIICVFLSLLLWWWVCAREREREREKLLTCPL